VDEPPGTGLIAFEEGEILVVRGPVTWLVYRRNAILRAERKKIYSIGIGMAE
jgi:hypothetical protein